jgi:hypothetical protein
MRTSFSLCVVIAFLLVCQVFASVFGTDIPGDGDVSCYPRSTCLSDFPALSTWAGTVASPALVSGGNLVVGGSTLGLQIATSPVTLTFSDPPPANPDPSVIVGPLGFNKLFNPVKNGPIGSGGSRDATIPISGQQLTLNIKNTASIPLTEMDFYLQSMAAVLPNGQPDGLTFGVYCTGLPDSSQCSPTNTPQNIKLLMTPTGPGTLNPADTSPTNNKTFGDLLRFTGINLAPNATGTFSFYITDYNGTRATGTGGAAPNATFTLQIVPIPVPTYTISGKVTLNGSGQSGVAVALTGSASNSTMTDGSGNYSFTGLVTGNYTLTPSKSGYTFAPPGASFNGLTTNQTANFTATLVPVMSLSQTTLNFGINGSFVTSPQTVALSFTAGANIAWTTSACPSNVIVSPSSGSGNTNIQVTASLGSGCIVTFNAPGAGNSPIQLRINVNIVGAGPPYGFYDIPLDNTTGVSGAIAMGGWALDNVEVTDVSIWREPVGSEPLGKLVFVGTATLVSGARPDVQAISPNVPFNYRAGWGYALLTNFLPNSSGPGTGNGTYKLHVIVTNKAGATTDLGTHSVTVDNAHATKPFGTIDTPAQGGTASGSAYINFAWALTPQPYIIPINGSTLTVIIDGQPVGQPTYNQFRADIAALFPGYMNSNGAVGFFRIDTTKLANGGHTISWNVFDSANRSEGIGSRYFNVTNAASGIAAPEEPPAELARPDSMRLHRGFDLNRPPDPLLADDNGVVPVEMAVMGRIEIEVGASEGYMLVNGERQPLPVGSSLKNGVFYWLAAPGFLGEYLLVFERPDSTSVQLKVTIRPKQFEH